MTSEPLDYSAWEECLYTWGGGPSQILHANNMIYGEHLFLRLWAMLYQADIWEAGVWVAKFVMQVPV